MGLVALLLPPVMLASRGGIIGGSGSLTIAIEHDITVYSPDTEFARFT